MRKFSEQFDSFAVIGSSRIFDLGKYAKVNSLFVVSDIGDPSLTILVLFLLRHSLESARVVARSLEVVLVVVLGAYSKIASAIVESIMVPMVNFNLASYCPNYFAVKKDCMAAMTLTSMHRIHPCVDSENLSIFTADLSKPPKMTELFKIFKVNYGYVPLCEGNCGVN